MSESGNPDLGIDTILNSVSIMHIITWTTYAVLKAVPDNKNTHGTAKELWPILTFPVQCGFKRSGYLQIKVIEVYTEVLTPNLPKKKRKYIMWIDPEAAS